MMEVSNAKITNVKVCFDDRGRLAARMRFETQYGCCDWGFILSNPVDVQRLSTLMNYTETYDIMQLNGKIVRKVDFDRFFRGFGHPIEDKFVPFSSKEFTEITEAEFLSNLKK